MGKFNKRVKALTGVFLAGAVVAGSMAMVNFKTDVKAASVDETFNKMIPVMELVAKEYAESFAEGVNNNVDLSVKQTTPIYDTNNNVVGYSVALENDNIDYGYVNIDYTSEGLVTDFSMSDNADSMYDALTEDFAIANDNVEVSDCDNKLISVDGLNYAVTSSDKGEDLFYYDGTTYESDNFDELLDYYEENYLSLYDNTEYEDSFIYESYTEDKQEVKKSIMDRFKNWVMEVSPNTYNKFWANDEFVAPTAYPKHGEVFKKETICELDTEVMLPQYSKEKSLLSQENVMKTTNRYACELVGITAICQQENMSLNNNLKDTFDKLWDLAGCQGRIYETDTFYGSYVVDCSSTYTRDMGRVMKEYAKLFNKDVDTTYKMSPKFKFFKDSIDKGNSTSFGYQIKNEGGHGVNVVGYAEGSIGKHEINYIITGDSWYDDAPRYVLYGRGLFEGTEANSFHVNDINK